MYIMGISSQLAAQSWGIRGVLSVFQTNAVSFIFPRAIFHAEDVYPDPYPFKPKRFLDEKGSLREDVPHPTGGFGYSRRICPGRYFALDILWLTIANILAVFTVEPSRDGHGDFIKPDVKFEPHFFRRVDVFFAYYYV